MTGDEYLELVRRHASQAGGTIGFRQFCRATRLPEKHFLRFGFDTWGAVLAAANVPAVPFFKPKADEDGVVSAFVNLAARLDRWPTENHLAVERRRDSSFPSLKVVRRLSRSGALAKLVVAHCSSDPALAHVGALAAEKVAEPVSSLPEERAHIEGYVYLMKTGRRYKIGHTTSPSRRHREVRLDLPEPTDLVHTIPTDDPAGIEEYWHRRFREKRIRDTEFFELDRADVIAFQARKYQ